MSGRQAGRRDIAAGGLALLGLAAAPAASRASAITAAPADPVVALWARIQAVDAEGERVKDEHMALRDLICRRRPGQPKGVDWVDWHRNDPDMEKCEALCDRSDKLTGLSTNLYNQIAVAVAVTPAGVRAKAAAALSIWVTETSLHEECGFSDLILNALREAAAGSAA